MIIVKNSKVFRDLLLVPYDFLLVNIMKYIEKKYGRIVITCGFRKGDKGVHGTIPCRGLDIRSHIYDNPTAQEIVNDINSRWQYDPDRPDMKTAILHDVGYGMHIHLQTHPKSIYVGDNKNGSISQS